jgi:hypothetical protein
MGPLHLANCTRNSPEIHRMSGAGALVSAMPGTGANPLSAPSVSFQAINTPLACAPTVHKT